MTKPCLDCGAPTSGSTCPPCRARREAARDAARGTTAERGYGAVHQAEHRRWAIRIAREPVLCARCHRPIEPHHDWHLDHDDEDRSRYLGPSHADCDSAAGGRKAHRKI